MVIQSSISHLKAEVKDSVRGWTRNFVGKQRSRFTQSYPGYCNATAACCRSGLRIHWTRVYASSLICWRGGERWSCLRSKNFKIELFSERLFSTENATLTHNASLSFKIVFKQKADVILIHPSSPSLKRSIQNQVHSRMKWTVNHLVLWKF